MSSPATAPMPVASSRSTTAQPSSAIHAVQIEINRALYMNEETLEPPGPILRGSRTI